MKLPWLLIPRRIVERMQHRVVEFLERACAAEVEAAHARTAEAQAELAAVQLRTQIAKLATRAARAEQGCVELTNRLHEAPPAPARVLH